jgi:endonuclease-8
MEGPSLVILTEELQPFLKKKIIAVSGNSTKDIERLEGKTIKSIKSWGKHLLIIFDKFSIRIHFLLFGSYRINDIKENRSPRLSLDFKSGTLNFYSCSLQFIEEDLDQIYDWKIDVMSDSFDSSYVLKKIKKSPSSMACDILMNQDIFAGVGNIIKNEVLFNLHLHPETPIGNLSTYQIKKLIKEARDYSFKFYEWKKVYELRKHWMIYKKRKCPRCELPVLSRKTGKGDRRSYYCTGCQFLIINK